MSASSTPARANPLDALDLDDFQPVSSPRPKPSAELVRQVSEASNFPSRAPKPKAQPAPALKPAPRRRHRTGRNVQVNIKMTAETAARLTALSDAQKWVFGETVERALEALEISLTAKEANR